MKIISKTKDYYDSIQIYGIDPKLIYIRKEENLEVKLKDFGYSFPLEFKFPVFNISIQSGMEPDGARSTLRNSQYFPIQYLFFCGRVYTTINYGVDKGDFSFNWDYLNTTLERTDTTSLEYLLQQRVY